MEPVTWDLLLEFLHRLGERFPFPGSVYLLGGSALCLLGNPQVTQDVDYTYELNPRRPKRLKHSCQTRRRDAP